MQSAESRPSRRLRVHIITARPAARTPERTAEGCCWRRIREARADNFILYDRGGGSDTRKPPHQAPEGEGLPEVRKTTIGDRGRRWRSPHGPRGPRSGLSFGYCDLWTTQILN